MNLYTDGEFDPDLARKELDQTGGITNDTVARRDVARIQTAALIDIAASLKVLALESALAMPGFDLATTPPEEDPEPTEFAIIMGGTGQRVAALFANGLEGVTTGKWGEDQGVIWVGVRWDFDDDTEERIFLDSLVALEAAELTEGYVAPVSTADGSIGYAPPAVADADDLDADFDGDVHTEATDALAALKARQKAAKKGGKK